MNRDKNVHEVKTYKVSLYHEDNMKQPVESVTVKGRPVTPFAKGFEMAQLRVDERLVVRVLEVK